MPELKELWNTSILSALFYLHLRAFKDQKTKVMALSQVNIGVNHPDGSLLIINLPPISPGNSIHLISGLISQKGGHL